MGINKLSRLMDWSYNTLGFRHSLASQHGIPTRLAKRMALSLLCIGISGCNTLYFHSDTDQKIMQEAQKNFTAAKDDHLRLAGQSFDELFNAQREAVINNELTYRNQRVVAALGDSNDKIKSLIEGQLSDLVGKNNKDEIKKLELVDIADNLNDHHEEILQMRQKIIFKAGQLGLKVGNAEEFCLTHKAELQADANEQAKNILLACIDLKDEITFLQNYEEKYSKVLELVKPSVEVNNKSTNGLIGPTLYELGIVSNLLDQQRKTQAAMLATLKKAEKAYACEQERAKQPGIDESIRDATALIDSFLKPGTPGVPQLAAAASPPVNGPPKCEEIKESWNIVFFRELKEQGVTPENLNQLIAVTQEVKPTLESAIRKSQADYAKSTFGVILNGMSNQNIPNGSAPAIKEAVIASKTVELLGYIKDYQLADSGQLPQLPALQIGLARARLASALADAELAFLNRKQQLLSVKLGGQLAEAKYLVDAEEKLDKGQRVPGIRRYGLAFSRGHLQSEVASWELNNLQFLAWLSRYQVLVKANYEVIEPAMGQLADYTAGGITNSDIAAIAHLFAMIAIAVGVN